MPLFVCFSFVKNKGKFQTASMVRPTWALDLQRGASPGNGLELAMTRTRASKFTLRAVAQLKWELGSPG